VLDAALIVAAQAVEHYEITRYGSMIAWSEELGREAIAKLLTTNLNEEKAADKKLTSIGEKKVNLKAAGLAAGHPARRPMNASFERTKSLWMSQTKVAESAPRLSEDLTCDVVIVGAGIAGLSVA
jgi:hypothetical protein